MRERLLLTYLKAVSAPQLADLDHMIRARRVVVFLLHVPRLAPRALRQRLRRGGIWEGTGCEHSQSMLRALIRGVSARIVSEEQGRPKKGNSGVRPAIAHDGMWESTFVSLPNNTSLQALASGVHIISRRRASWSNNGISNSRGGMRDRTIVGLPLLPGALLSRLPRMEKLSEGGSGKDTFYTSDGG